MSKCSRRPVSVPPVLVLSQAGTCDPSQGDDSRFLRLKAAAGTMLLPSP